MIMRSFPVTIIVIILLISGCFLSACISDKTESQPPAAIVVASPLPTPVPVISFDTARDNLGSYLDTDPRTNPDGVKSYLKANETISIRFIQGMNIDTSGNARVWTFGVQTKTGNELRAYDQSGWTIIPLNETFSSGEIVLDHIISPSALIEMNRDAISQMSSSGASLRNVELNDGVYTITFRGTPKILRFDATTGAPIESKT
jgi:hypothetical protein